MVQEGITYKGDFVDGQYHGEGELTSSGDDEVFKGFWKKGKKHGKAEIHHSKTQRLEEGSYKDGFKHGTWKIYANYTNRDVYEEENYNMGRRTKDEL